MNEINIFWIEDNPIQDAFVETASINYPSFRVTNHDHSFVFTLFQHPQEVREYLSMIHSLRRANSVSVLAQKCSQAMPNIVVFDYRLSENFNTSNPTALQYNRPDQCLFIRKHSAAVRLKNAFPEQFGDRVLFSERPTVVDGNYDPDEFRDEMQINTLPLDDEFGLFSGISIVREFKDYVTVGVPATFNKADKADLSPNAAFFEWLNSYDIEEAIKRPQRGNKNWDDIAAFAIPLLQSRIAQQVQSGHVTVSYQQLLNMANGSNRLEYLEIQSVYGEQLLPLDGLFLGDNDEMKSWASSLIRRLPPEHADVNNARNISKTIWHTYVENFEDRILLSDYAHRTTILNASEKTNFEDIKSKLCDPTGEKIAPECSIQTLTESCNKPTIRLIVLLIVSQAAIELEKCREFAPSREEYVDLSSYDFFNVLFPKVNLQNQMILPMHSTSQADDLIDTPRKWLLRALTLDGSKVSQANWFKFDKWITPGEKALLRCLLYEQRQYYPRWLR
jgi:hypothetical protein